MKIVSLVVLASSALASAATNTLDRRAPSGSYANTLSKNQRELFLWGMDALDNLYSDPLIFDSPRYSAWYAVGLLARNGKGDVDEAKKIIREAISYQWKDPSHEWFGTFKNRISAPDPSDIWPPKLYTSFDPNQGTFVVCAFIIAMEEFQHLLDRSLVQLMKESMYNATIGEGNRIAGQNNDNIWPIYSNPFYMRVTSATYVGNMMGDKNMTKWAEIWAEQAIYEFDQYDTISEFNSGTYTGVSLWVLSLYGYLPKDSRFYQRAPDMIAKSWRTIGEVYNPTLHSLSGPFDRSFGVNMRSYFGMLGAQITGLIGGLSDRTAPLPVPLYPGGHLGDAASLAIIPLSSKFHDQHVPKEVVRKLAKLDKPHTHFEQALSPPFDNRGFPRNYTFYVGNGVSAGGIVTDSCVVGGAAMNQGQHVPAVIMWDAGVEMGWFQLYSTNSYTHAVATASTLTVSYPPSVAFAGNASLPISNQMTFMLSGQRRHTLPVDFMSTVGYSYELNGLRLTLKDSNIAAGSKFSYGSGTWNDLQYYNLTYTVPANLGATPFVQFEFEKIQVKTKHHDEEL